MLGASLITSLLRRIPALFLMLAMLGPMLVSWFPQRPLCGTCRMDRSNCCCVQVVQEKEHRGPICRCPSDEQPYAVPFLSKLPALLPGTDRVHLPQPTDALVADALVLAHQLPLDSLERPPRG